jgi:hypothetical protein
MTRRTSGYAAIGECCFPWPGKSFSAFQSDQAVCRQFADQAVRDQAQGANVRGLGPGNRPHGDLLQLRSRR